MQYTKTWVVFPKSELSGICKGLSPVSTHKNHGNQNDRMKGEKEWKVMGSSEGSNISMKLQREI